MASCCTHPIDQQKYRMQVVKGKTGMLESLSRTARTAGGCGGVKCRDRQWLRAIIAFLSLASQRH
jgi:hypothetical protein